MITPPQTLHFELVHGAQVGPSSDWFVALPNVTEGSGRGFPPCGYEYAGGRPPKFDTAQREQVKQIALARPTDHGLPFSTWSLSKLADYLVAQGVVEDISHEGLRMLLREEGVSLPGGQDLEDQH